MAGENVLDAKMTLENSGFISAMSKARESTSKALEVMKAATLGLTGLGGAFAAFRSVEGVIEGVMGAFERGRELMDLSKQTMTNVSSLVVLQQAFRDTGASADGVGHTVFMLQKALGGVSETGEPTATIFQKLGLSIAGLKQMDTVSQFQAIAKGLSAIRDPSEQSAAAMKIFGRSAMDVMGLLRDPAAFGKAVQDVGKIGDIMQKNAAAFAQLSKSIELVKTNIGGMFDGIAEGLAPTLQQITNVVNSIDFVGIGQKIGRVVGTIAEAFKEGKLSELVELSLKVGFEKAANEMAGIFGVISDVFDSAMKNVFTPDFFEGIKAGFLGVADAFAAAMTALLPSVSKSLSEAADNFQATMKGISVQEFRKQRDEADMLSYLKQNVAVPGDASKMRDPEAARYALIDALIHRYAAGKDSSFQDKRGFTDKLSNIQRTGDSYTLAGLTKNQWQAGSDSELQKASGLLVKSMTGVPALINAAMAALKSYKPGQIFSDKDSDALQKLLASIKLPQDTTTSSDDPNKGPGGGLGRTSNYKAPDADRLARIGLFVGGAPSAPGLSEAKRTAAATEKALGLLKQILVKHSDGSSYRDLVYAE